MDVELVDPCREPVPPGWDRFVAEQGLVATWSADVLTAWAWSARTPRRLALLRDGGQVRGLVSAGYDGPPLWRRRFVPPGRLPWLGVLDVRVPMCSALAGWAFAPDVDERERVELFGGYRRAAAAQLGAGFRGVLWRQVDHAALPLLGASRRLVRPIAGVAILERRWDDLDGYLATLSRSRRGDLRRQRRLIDTDPDLTVTEGSGAAVDPAQATVLFRDNERKYAGRALRRLPLAYGGIARLLGHPRVRTIAYRDSTGRLLGLGVALDHDRWPVFQLWGALPADRGGRSHLYYDAYLRLISWVVATGKAGLIGGKGRLDVKSSLGFRTQPLYAVFTPR